MAEMRVKKAKKMSKQKVKRAKKASKQGVKRAKNLGSEEFSVMGAINEEQYRAPIDVLAIASQLSGRYIAPDEIRQMAEKAGKRKVKARRKKK